MILALLAWISDRRISANKGEANHAEDKQKRRDPEVGVLVPRRLRQVFLLTHGFLALYLALIRWNEHPGASFSLVDPAYLGPYI